MSAGRHWRGASGAIRRRRWAGARCCWSSSDVWRLEQLEPLLAVLDTGTRVLVTTRDVAVATGAGVTAIELGLLGEAAALRHLADWTGVAPDALPSDAAVLA